MRAGLTATVAASIVTGTASGDAVANGYPYLIYSSVEVGQATGDANADGGSFTVPVLIQDGQATVVIPTPTPPVRTIRASAYSRLASAPENARTVRAKARV